MPRPFFTLFTPAYNCENTIHRVFSSVAKQTFRDFEWIIINDGSKDNSSEVIKNLIKKDGYRDIEITLLEFENFGKHSVWNKGVKLGRGKFFVPADADDAFLPDALEFFYQKISSFSVEQLDTISGINVICLDNDTENIVGDSYPTDGYICTNFELKYKLNLSGEKWGCIKLDLLKLYPFPEIRHSNYPEDYIWFTLGKTYKVICYNKPLRKYYTTENGITFLQRVRNKNERKVYIKYYSWLLLHFGGRILKYSPKRFFKHLARIAADTLYVYFK
jgi:glycosyltransferase involved in cell wall biosynthesis